MGSGFVCNNIGEIHLLAIILYQISEKSIWNNIYPRKQISVTRNLNEIDSKTPRL